MRIIVRTLMFFVAGMLLVAGPTQIASAQPVEVEGTTDFRVPPILTPGTYTDTIVTGETVWYGVVYTNNTPFRFEATLDGVDLTTNDELELEISFISPTLGGFSDRSGLLDRPGASYSGGTTNTWYVTVALSTTGQLGVQYNLLLDIEGVEEADFDDCTQDPECDLDDQLVELELQLAEQEQQLADLEQQVADLESAAPGTEPSAPAVPPGTDPSAAVQEEIDRLRTEVDANRAAVAAAEESERSARTAMDEADREIAALCAPETTCTEPPPLASTTPGWALGAGGLVLVAGLGLLARKVMQR